jgi:hypothetical protein
VGGPTTAREKFAPKKRSAPVRGRRLQEYQREPTPNQRQEFLKGRERGETLTDIGKTYGVSHTTIMRLAGPRPRVVL